jgi:hypothetical protein
MRRTTQLVPGKVMNLSNKILDAFFMSGWQSLASTVFPILELPKAVDWYMHFPIMTDAANVRKSLKQFRSGHNRMMAFSKDNTEREGVFRILSCPLTCRLFLAYTSCSLHRNGTSLSSPASFSAVPIIITASPRDPARKMHNMTKVEGKGPA